MVPPEVLVPPPPQPIIKVVTTATKRLNRALLVRQRAGMPKKHSSAKTAPPAGVKNSFICRLNALLFAVVSTVRIAVFALPVMLTEDEERLHVGGEVRLFGLTEQVRFTVPVKPPDGVTVIVEVLPEVAPRLTVMFPLLLKPKPGGGAWLTVTDAVAVAVA